VSTSLEPALEAVIRLSAIIASRDESELAQQLHRVAEVSDITVVEEAILQSYLFVGYPAALNAMAAWREVSGVAAPPPAADDRDRWIPRGEAICSNVYGGQYEGLRANIRKLHPEMEQWMVEEGYGKVLGRTGLSLQERELCIVALLAVLVVPRQLYSHLRGALNTGASRAQVAEALAIGLEYASAGSDQALESWDAVCARHDGGP
jgi:4-carboxymuconolactone decarboxylase